MFEDSLHFHFDTYLILISHNGYSRLRTIHIFSRKVLRPRRARERACMLYDALYMTRQDNVSESEYWRNALCSSVPHASTSQCRISSGTKHKSVLQWYLSRRQSGSLSEYLDQWEAPKHSGWHCSWRGCHSSPLVHECSNAWEPYSLSLFTGQGKAKFRHILSQYIEAVGGFTQSIRSGRKRDSFETKRLRGVLKI